MRTSNAILMVVSELSRLLHSELRPGSYRLLHSKYMFLDGELLSLFTASYRMGTFQETLSEGNEGALHLGPEHARVYSDLSPEDKYRYNADVWATNILLQGLPKDIYTLINHYTDAKDIWDNVKMLLEGTMHKFKTTGLLFRMFRVDKIEDRGTMQGVQVQHVMGVIKLGVANGYSELGYEGAWNRLGNANAGQARQIKCYNCNGGQDNAVDEDVDEQPVQDLALTVMCFKLMIVMHLILMCMRLLLHRLCSWQISHPHILFMMKPVRHMISDILSEVPYHDNYQDAVCKHHEVHEMHDDYVKENAVLVVQSNESSVPNDAYMMILNDIYEPSAQCVFVTTQNNVVDNLLTAELATYKEQVELYERRTKFELTEREQNINEQLRIVIADRNLKEENLKKELHSIKLQLTSTINHNKSMVEEFKDKLYKQDQSLQTVHMLCKPKPYYNEQNKVASLTRAQQVQPALYNGHGIIKTNHVPAIVHNSEDILEIAEITRKKMNDKMKDPECVKKKVKIAPHDYLKENYLTTFTPQKKLTLEQIFWSKDLIKMKEEALKG
ncbi:hypothetical protein Tco_0956639 [Tanacetum coccineum]